MRSQRQQALCLYAFSLLALVGAVGMLVLLTGRRPAVEFLPRTPPVAAAMSARLGALTLPVGESLVTAALQASRMAPAMGLEFAGAHGSSPRIPWRVLFLPEGTGRGEPVLLSGTMDTPEGMAGDEEVTMTVYYTGDDGAAAAAARAAAGGAPDWLDPLGLVRPLPGGGPQIASRIQYSLNNSGGRWEFDLDLPLAASSPAPVAEPAAVAESAAVAAPAAVAAFSIAAEPEAVTAPAAVAAASPCAAAIRTAVQAFSGS